jgi:fido (protein-threonine AMPylation protein)
MPSPNTKLAESLDVLKELQAGGRRVFRSDEFSRLHRERLVQNGFLQEVMKGWLVSASPSARAGDSTPWYASFWEFCAQYANDRFGQTWHLSPEQSLLLHGERTVIPQQVVVCSPKAANHTLELLFGTSLFDLRVAEMPDAADLVVRDSLRLFSPPAALVKVAETFFSRNPVETQVVLASLMDASDVLRILLNGGHSAKAGYVARAFRQTGRPEFADEILAAMKSAGYDVRESNPFEAGQVFVRPARTAAPIVGRLQMLWESTRSTVLELFPKAPGLPKNRAAYLQFVDEIYQSDAYHSLSIEGYSVTPALVERVREGNWDPEHHEDDRRSRDALAARGYWQAFQAVKRTVENVLGGHNPGAVARAAHREWYRELFQPCVAAGLIQPAALAGYKNMPVYLRTSRYVPPRWEAARDAMSALFDLLEEEPEPGVRAVLGHWLFGYIHPYQDGNGRMARFLMNAMLASGGYPWTVIRVRDRDAYLAGLDRASIDLEIRHFTEFLVERVRWSLEQHDLTFPEPEAQYDFDRGVVVFWAYDGKRRVRCGISREALDDHYGADQRDIVEAFQEHRQEIAERARRRYLAGDTERDGSVLIRTTDL